MQLALFCTLLVLVAGGCLAHKPQPCESPAHFEGGLSVVAQNDYSAYGKFAYDAALEGIRFRELIYVKNQTVAQDFLLLYKEHKIYLIDDKTKTCQVKTLTAQFHPLKVPGNATHLGQVVLGSLSARGEGLLVNTWVGETPKDQGGYMLTVTELGCVPVSLLYKSPKTGGLLISFFNINHQHKDPSVFIPPPFCEKAALEAGQEGDFFSPFF